MTKIISRYRSIQNFIDFHQDVHFEDKFRDLIIDN